MDFNLEDMREFADKHRGKNKTSGPHWPLVFRFPVLFDEYEKLLNENKKLRNLLNGDPEGKATPQEINMWRESAVRHNASMTNALSEIWLLCEHDRPDWISAQQVVRAVKKLLGEKNENG